MTMRLSLTPHFSEVSGVCIFSPESHQRSWWIVHTQPTKRAGHTPVPNPTNEVGGSFILCLQKDRRMLFPNSTNEVGRSFILSLQSSSELRGFCSPSTQFGGIPNGVRQTFL